MNRLAIPMLVALAAIQPASAQDTPDRPIGEETTIKFAADGGIRNWQAGPEDNIVYVQDRQLRWYQVTLSGPCLSNLGLETMLYDTGPDGTLDRFSRVWSARRPNQVCGVESIRTSLPPQGQPGAPKPAGD